MHIETSEKRATRQQKNGEREREREKGDLKKKEGRGWKGRKTESEKRKGWGGEKKAKPRYGCTNRSLIKVSIVFRSRNAIISIQSSLVTLQWRRPDTCYTQTTIKRKKEKKEKKKRREGRRIKVEKRKKPVYGPAWKLCRNRSQS